MTDLPAGEGRISETVPVALDGERLDRVVAFLTGLPRSAADGIVADGRATIEGRVVTNRSRRLRTGQSLEILVPPTAIDAADQPDPDVEVPVVWEDESVIVVDKPAGMVVHPGAGHDRGTLVQGLLARYPDLAALAAIPGAAHRPGIVHRLDRGTSGLLVVARTPEAVHHLVAQLAARQVERAYLALLHGAVDSDEGLVDAPVGRSERDPTRIVVRRDGKVARTRYEVKDRYSEPVPATLVECHLETGRTHQIRVHMTAIGHPVVNDDRYGPRPAGWSGLPAGRPWLHAQRLGFEHPRDGRAMSFSSPLPDDLRRSLDALSPPQGPERRG